MVVALEVGDGFAEVRLIPREVVVGRNAEIAAAAIFAVVVLGAHFLAVEHHGHAVHGGVDGIGIHQRPLVVGGEDLVVRDEVEEDGRHLEGVLARIEGVPDEGGRAVGHVAGLVGVGAVVEEIIAP